MKSARAINPWVVFFRTHREKFASRDEELADCCAKFQHQMKHRLSKVEVNRWTSSRKKAEYHKILCAYFKRCQRAAGKDSIQNTRDIQKAVYRILTTNGSTRASLLSIETMGPSCQTLSPSAPGPTKEYVKREHQRLVFEFMQTVADHPLTKGLLLAHGMGSGKTLTSLWVAKDFVLQKRVPFVYIVAPKVSVCEFLESFERAGISPTTARRIRVLTHDEFVCNKDGHNFRRSLVIVDEAHLFTKKRYSALVERDVPFVMLLSGTPAPNSTDEIVPLINLLCKRDRDKMTKKEWNMKPANSTERKRLTQTRIDFMRDKVAVYNIGSEFNYMGRIGLAGAKPRDHLPGYTVNNLRVRLSAEQEKKYVRLLKTSDPSPFFRREKRLVYAKSPLGAASAKIARVAKDMVDEYEQARAQGDPWRLYRGRMLAFVATGAVRAQLIDELDRVRAKRGLSPLKIAEYTGSTPASVRKSLKHSFNRGEIDVLIISSAGAVGLDLKCTAKVFVVDVSWSIPQMNQIIGRAIRFNSHAVRKPGQPPWTGCRRKDVEVYVYTSKLSSEHRVFDEIVLEHARNKWAPVADMIQTVLSKAQITRLPSAR